MLVAGQRAVVEVDIIATQEIFGRLDRVCVRLPSPLANAHARDGVTVWLPAAAVRDLGEPSRPAVEG